MDKNQILNVLSTAQIYCKFLNLQSFPDKNICSPFSNDKNPSFKLYKNGTFKCFSSGKQGDVFQLIADLNGLDCKQDFKRVSDLIADAFNLTNGINFQPGNPAAEAKMIPFNNATGVDGVPNRPGSGAEDNPVKVGHHEKFSPGHLKFWNDLGIDDVLLNLYKVRPVKYFKYWSDKKSDYVMYPIYKTVLSFSYEVNKRFEVYTPAQPDKKIKKMFCSGLLNSDIFGLSQLPDERVDMLVICAGAKDCLSLVSRGFPAVSFRSEAIFPTAEQINLLKSKCKYLYICYDNDFDNPDNPGRNQMLKIAEKYALLPVLLPDKINDCTDYFQAYNAQDFRQLIESVNKDIADREQADSKSKETIFHIAERYLSAYYDFRFNSVKLDIEVSPKRMNSFTSLNENSLYIELQKKGINISMDKLLSVLKSEYVQRFDPFLHYFKSLPKWSERRDGDVIARLASFINSVDKESFIYHFRKWLVRTVKCATVPDYFNKQAFILVHSEQNSGKSTFCRFLCPPSLSDYLAEDISNDKDARILLCKNFLINLDELAVLSRQEINSLKSYFSKTQINERLPYDRKNSIINRTCSFVGSTNMDEFLNDETGSVRWLCFRINSINWDYRAQIDINRVWAQAFALSLDSSFDYELSREDILNNEERNKDFQIMSREKALIHKFFYIPKVDDFPEFMTATDIDLYLRGKTYDYKLTTVGIGKGMKSLGFERHKQDGVYGYFVCKRDDK